MGDLLTPEERDRFGWKSEISTLGPVFKKYLIQPLLVLGSFSGGAGILSLLSEVSEYTILPILSILKEIIDNPKAGDWRIIRSGLAVILMMIRKHSRSPELPELFLRFLNKNLGSKIGTLKSQAVMGVLIVCYTLRVEYDFSQPDYIRKDIEKVAGIIDPEKLKSAVNLERLVDSWDWRFQCESIGYKWKDSHEDANWNRNRLLEVLRTYWPAFLLS